MEDKDFIVIEGATHGGTGCTECTAVTGVDYSNARKNIYDYVAAWSNAPRFYYPNENFCLSIYVNCLNV